MIPVIGALVATFGASLLVFGIYLYDPRAAMVLSGIMALSTGVLIMIASARVRRNKG